MPFFIPHSGKNSGAYRPSQRSARTSATIVNSNDCPSAGFLLAAPHRAVFLFFLVNRGGEFFRTVCELSFSRCSAREVVLPFSVGFKLFLQTKPPARYRAGGSALRVRLRSHRAAHGGRGKQELCVLKRNASKWIWRTEAVLLSRQLLYSIYVLFCQVLSRGYYNANETERVGKSIIG